MPACPYFQRECWIVMVLHAFPVSQHKGNTDFRHQHFGEQLQPHGLSASSLVPLAGRCWSQRSALWANGWYEHRRNSLECPVYQKGSAQKLARDNPEAPSEVKIFLIWSFVSLKRTVHTQEDSSATTRTQDSRQWQQMCPRGSVCPGLLSAFSQFT